MKVLQKLPIPTDRAFECWRLRAPHFDPNWHFHGEYQLFIVLQGTGTRFVGDHVAPFGPGDLVLTGPDLPHLWRSDPEYFEGEDSLVTDGIVVYFREQLFGRDFLQTVEMLAVRQLLQRAARGIRFHGPTVVRMRTMLEALVPMKGFTGILHFLSMLHGLSAAEDYVLLAHPGYANNLREPDTERMNRVHAFVMRRFRERIALEEVAAVANMTPPAFSRYFRVHANKTFTEFLCGIRLGYACKLLAANEMTVTEVCFQSGFNTLSNFNRQFRTYVGVTPVEYRRSVNA